MSLNYVDQSTLTVAGTSIGLSSASPTKLTAWIAGARQATIEVLTAPVYYRTDGDAATTADSLLAVGDVLNLLGDSMNQALENIRFIRATSTSATLIITWYNREPVLSERVTRGAVRFINNIGLPGAITKTIQTELQAISALAASVQGISSVLDLSGTEKKVAIFIDHAKDSASAAVGQGTEYVIQVSEKASGNDTWRTVVPFTGAITAPVAMVTDGAEAVSSTVIECATGVPAIGDIVFFKSATIGNSEWSNVVARSTAAGSENVTLESGLTYAQAASTYFTQGEHFVQVIDTEAFTRLRVVANNQKGTTNMPIVWRCSAITVV